MKFKILLFFLLFYSGTIFSQKATIQSFDHTARWVSEQTFPNYISDKHLQDTILLVTSEALKRKFSVKEVFLPTEIAYKYYSTFGKPKLKEPKFSTTSNDYFITILSFITRDTYSTKVYWNMEIAVQQNGVTSFSNKKVHELEYFASSDSWQINESEFIRIFASLIEELLDDTKKVSEKIIIDSQKNVEDIISTSITNSEKLKMITKGNFMAGSDFSISIEKDEKVLSSVVYHDGKKTSKGKGNFTGWLLANTTTALLGSGSSSSYMKKTKEKRLGTLDFSNGEVRQLKMEWEQNTEKEVASDDTSDGLFAKRTGYSEQLSPMKIEIMKNDSIYGNLTYFKKEENFVVEGEIQNHPISVSYVPSSNLVRVIENSEPKVIVEMYNVNPETSDSFAGNKNSHKIFFPSTKNKLPEWYNVYVDQNINKKDTIYYLEAVFCLFFGMGNHT